MGLFSLSRLRAGGGTGLHGDAGIELARALAEVQGVQVTVVTGNVGANTNMTLTGVKTTDTILGVIEEDSTSGVSANHSGTVTITAANTIRSTAATTGKNLIVRWAAKPA